MVMDGYIGDERRLEKCEPGRFRCLTCMRILLVNEKASAMPACCICKRCVSDYPTERPRTEPSDEH